MFSINAVLVVGHRGNPVSLDLLDYQVPESEELSRYYIAGKGRIHSSLVVSVVLPGFHSLLISPVLPLQRWSFFTFSLEDGFSTSAQLDFNRSLYSQMSVGPKVRAMIRQQTEFNLLLLLSKPPPLLFYRTR